MRILIVAHTGETLGHLAKGLAIADELIARGCHVEIAASQKGEKLIRTWNDSCTHHILRWAWSHNSCDLDGPSSNFFRLPLETASDILALLRSVRPDIVVGLPGILSTQASRHFGIRHVSILHGPYLAPRTKLANPNPVESAILELAKKVCLGPVNKGFSLLSQTFGVPWLDYQMYLQTETIFVPHPGLEMAGADNIRRFGFVRSSIGAPFDPGGPNPSGACLVTFGSGNPCDISRIIRLTRTVFESVIVTAGQLNPGKATDGIFTTKRYVAYRSLAGRVAAVVCHGGVGTVGTFAESGTPMLIIPTEIDQAITAIYASRLGIARHCGLASFKQRKKLGRQLPDFSDEEFLANLRILQHTDRQPGRIVSSGAAEIASAIVQ